MEKDKAEVLHIEEAVNDNYADKALGVTNGEIIEEAREATDNEHALTLRKAFASYKPAILWSMVFSATIIMEGTIIFLCLPFSHILPSKRNTGLILEMANMSFSPNGKRLLEQPLMLEQSLVYLPMDI